MADSPPSDFSLVFLRSLILQRKPLSTRKKVLFSLLAFFGCMVVCEVMLRVFDVYYHPLKIEIHGIESDWRLAHSFEFDCFVYDPDRIWRPKKDFDVFNAQGFRGKELSEPKQPNEYRIFTIGDSNTLGWRDTDRNKGANWPADLQQLMPEPPDPSSVSTNPAKQYSVTNAGIWGYSSYQGLQQLKDILVYQPDMVTVSFGSNDAMLVTIPDTQFTATLFESIIGRTRIGQLAIQLHDNIEAGAQDIDDGVLVHRVSPDEYRTNLREIARICKENGIECVFLTRPFIGDCEDHISPELWWKHFAPQYVDATIEAGREADVTVIDIYSHFKDREDLFADESHFTIEGHALAAEFIYEQIKPLLPQ